MASGIQIRPARPEDTGAIYGLIGELADFENLRHEVTGTEKMLHDSLFGTTPTAEALVGSADGSDAVHGYAIVFSTFSTFLLKPGLWLEDVYVTPAQRGRGLGRGLLLAVAQLAVERDCGRLEWNVLDWNEPAQQLYASVGAELKREWLLNRVSGDALRQMAALATPDS